MTKDEFLNLNPNRPMTTKTVEALQKSIRHWHRLATGKRLSNETMSASDCALCRLFAVQSPQCRGCPVYETTGAPLCRRSPYRDAVYAFQNSGSYASSDFLSAAREELNFLLGLLPAEARPAMDAELAALEA